MADQGRYYAANYEANFKQWETIHQLGNESLEQKTQNMNCVSNSMRGQL